MQDAFAVGTLTGSQDFESGNMHDNSWRILRLWKCWKSPPVVQVHEAISQRPGYKKGKRRSSCPIFHPSSRQQQFSLFLPILPRTKERSDFAPEIVTGSQCIWRSARGFPGLPPSVSELTRPCPPRPSRHTLYPYRLEPPIPVRYGSSGSLSCVGVNSR